MGDFIDIHNDHQLQDLANRLRITPQEIVKLAGEVGPDTDHIRDVLKRRELENSGGRVPADAVVHPR